MNSCRESDVNYILRIEPIEFVNGMHVHNIMLCKMLHVPSLLSLSLDGGMTRDKETKWKSIATILMIDLGGLN